MLERVIPCAAEHQFVSYNERTLQQASGIVHPQRICALFSRGT